MGKTARTEVGDKNRLMSLSLRRPVLVMLALLFIASLIKILDIFVFPLDELLGEAILTKLLGFGLVVAYVAACGRRLRDIGFHARVLTQSLLIAGVAFISLYAVAFAAQIVALNLGGEDAGLALSAVDPRTGLSGGLLFGLWLVTANLVNSAMEEGLFRGAMIRHFLIRYSAWGAILLQAGLFAAWHLTVPIGLLLDGESVVQVVFEGGALLVATGIAGVVYGYLYFKTDNIWAPFLAHTINNSVFNILFIQTGAGLQSGLEFGMFTGIFLVGYVLLIPIIWTVTKWLKMPEVKPWR